MNYRTRYLFSSQYVHFSMYFRITHVFDCCWQCFFSSCLIVYQPSCEVQKTYIPKPDTFHINTLLDSKRLGKRAGMGETVGFGHFWAKVAKISRTPQKSLDPAGLRRSCTEDMGWNLVVVFFIGFVHFWLTVTSCRRADGCSYHKGNKNKCFYNIHVSTPHAYPF